MGVPFLLRNTTKNEVFLCKGIDIDSDELLLFFKLIKTRMWDLDDIDIPDIVSICKNTDLSWDENLIEEGYTIINAKNTKDD